jgi:hypothetical protein
MTGIIFLVMFSQTMPFPRAQAFTDESRACQAYHTDKNARIYEMVYVVAPGLDEDAKTLDATIAEGSCKTVPQPEKFTYESKGESK